MLNIDATALRELAKRFDVGICSSSFGQMIDGKYCCCPMTLVYCGIKDCKPQAVDGDEVFAHFDSASFYLGFDNPGPKYPDAGELYIHGQKLRKELADDLVKRGTGY